MPILGKGKVLYKNVLRDSDEVGTEGNSLEETVLSLCLTHGPPGEELAWVRTSKIRSECLHSSPNKMTFRFIYFLKSGAGETFTFEINEEETEGVLRSHITVRREFALHTTYMGSNLDIPYCFPSPSGVIFEHCWVWAFLLITPKEDETEGLKR